MVVVDAGFCNSRCSFCYPSSYSSYSLVVEKGRGMTNKKYAVLDKLFSQYIRMRAIQKVGGCERCLTYKLSWKQLQCCHFYGRAKKSVRLDEDNAVGLCGACHMYFTAHPLEFVEWFKARLGDKFDLLQGRMRVMEKPDVELLTLYYTELLKEV